jgi:hypothetical protein
VAKGLISFMEKWYIHRLGFATERCYVQFVFRQRGLGGAARGRWLAVRLGAATAKVNVLAPGDRRALGDFALPI